MTEEDYKTRMKKLRTEHKLRLERLKKMTALINEGGTKNLEEALRLAREGEYLPELELK